MKLLSAKSLVGDGHSVNGSLDAPNGEVWQCCVLGFGALWKLKTTYLSSAGLTQPVHMDFIPCPPLACPLSSSFGIGPHPLSLWLLTGVLPIRPLLGSKTMLHLHFAPLLVCDSQF